MYTFVLMMKKRDFDSELQLVTAVTEDEVDIMYETLEDTVNEEFASDYDFICYTFTEGQLVEVSLYDKLQEDFDVLMKYEKE